MKTEQLAENLFHRAQIDSHNVGREILVAISRCREFRRTNLPVEAVALGRIIPTQTRTKIMRPQLLVQQEPQEPLVQQQVREPQEGEGRRWPS